MCDGDARRLRWIWCCFGRHCLVSTLRYVVIVELELELELELGLELFGDGEGLMLECEMILWLRKSVGELKMVRF